MDHNQKFSFFFYDELWHLKVKKQAEHVKQIYENYDDG